MIDGEVAYIATCSLSGASTRTYPMASGDTLMFAQWPF